MQLGPYAAAQSEINLCKVRKISQRDGTHSILNAKQIILFFKIFWFIFQFLKPKRDCYVKFTCCSRTVKATLKI